MAEARETEKLGMASENVLKDIVADTLTKSFSKMNWAKVLALLRVTDSQAASKTK